MESHSQRKYLALETSQNGKKSQRNSRYNGKKNIKLKNLILNDMKKILVFIKNIKDWVAVDGLLHFAFSALLILIAFPIIKWWSLLFALLVGLLKEVYDITVKKSDARLSIHDLICDCIGIIMTVILLLVGYEG